MPKDYIRQTDPYSAPSGFTKTTTAGGGTAYLDPEGNLYVRDASGFRLRNDLRGPGSVPSGGAPQSTQPTMPTGPTPSPQRAGGIPDVFTAKVGNQTQTIKLGPDGKYHATSPQAWNSEAILTPEDAARLYQSTIPTPQKTVFKNSEAYKSLSDDARALVDMAYSTFMGTSEEQEIFANSLKQAQALADPYSKSQLLLFESEFKLAVAKTNNDYETQLETLDRTRSDIAAELKLNRDFLNLEQQASISRELVKYDEDLLNIADQAAEKGITFATGARSRALSEERRATQYQDVIQSGTRVANFKIKDLELRAARGDVAAAKELENIPKRRGFELTRIGQAAERILGSANASALGIEGYTPIGGSLGEVEQERRKSILEAAAYGLPKT